MEEESRKPGHRGASEPNLKLASALRLQVAWLTEETHTHCTGAVTRQNSVRTGTSVFHFHQMLRGRSYLKCHLFFPLRRLLFLKE